VRQMNEDELDDIRRNAIEYLELWQRDYRGGQSRAVRAAAEGEALQ
jgi:hypothetical protein